MAEAETQVASAGLQCCLCQETFEDGSAGRKHGQQFTCKSCLAMDKMIRRQVGCLSDMTEEPLTLEQKREFFKKARSETASNGRITWRTVKSCLETELLAIRRMEHETLLGGAFLPLGAWEKKGYDPKKVKEGCQSRWDEQLQEDVYKVKVLAEHDRDLRATVQKELLKKEQEVALKKKKKGGKRKRDSLADEDQDSDEWDVVKEVSEKKSEALANEGEGEADARAKRPTPAQVKKANHAKSLTALKALQSCTTCNRSLDGVLKQVEKNPVSAELTTALSEASEQLRKWAKESTDFLALFESQKENCVELPELTFDASSAATAVRAANTTVRGVRAELRASKPPKAAKTPRTSDSPKAPKSRARAKRAA